MVDHQGPCAPWITVEDVRACGPCSDEAALADEAIEAWLMPASQFMWAATARQFPGECTDTVRPVARRWHSRPRYGWCSSREVGLRWPVRSITAVHVNGALLTETTDYVLVDRRWLRRVNNTWPTVNDLDVAGTTEHAFQVEYKWGADPPDLAVRGAAQLACELARLCAGGDDTDCTLDPRIVSLARSGATFSLPLLADQLFEGRTGLSVADAAIRAYNPTGAAEGTIIVNPDERAAMLRRRA